MSQVCGFITDGQHVTGKINGVARLYPDVVVTYRPMTRTEVNAQSTKILVTEDAALQEKLSSSALERHLKSWNLKLRDGSVAPINQATLLALQPALYERLYRVIMGRQAPDEILEGEEALSPESPKN